jgi:sRNA-binding carbon storage regulator CsrA
LNKSCKYKLPVGDQILAKVIQVGGKMMRAALHKPFVVQVLRIFSVAEKFAQLLEV